LILNAAMAEFVRTHHADTVGALGETAARVEVRSAAGIPDKFKLAIADDGFSRACDVTIKHGRVLELAFV
jgi:hypothetical protein